MLDKFLPGFNKGNPNITTKIGKFLSIELNKGNTDTMCPTDEDLTAFLDAKLDTARRDAIMGHLSSCDDCHELFTETINVHEELSKEEEPSKVLWLNPKFLVFKLVPCSLATAAAILMMLYLFRDNSIDRLSFVKERIAMLASDVGSESSFLYARNEGTTYDFSFADVPTPKNISFRMGVTLADIQMAIMASDKESTISLLNNIIALLKSTKVSGRSIFLCEDMKKEIEESGSFKQYTNRIDNAILAEINEPVFVRFGQWCEGGRIATITGTVDFYRIDDIKIFIESLEKESLPKGVIKSLHEIGKIVKAGVYTEKQFRQLEKEYENLISLH